MCGSGVLSLPMLRLQHSLTLERLSNVEAVSRFTESFSKVIIFPVRDTKFGGSL